MVEYDFTPDADDTLYVLGEAGILWHKYTSDVSADTSESGFGYAAALGYGFPLGGINGWAEGPSHVGAPDSGIGLIDLPGNGLQDQCICITQRQRRPVNWRGVCKVRVKHISDQ